MSSGKPGNNRPWGAERRHRCGETPAVPSSSPPGGCWRRERSYQGDPGQPPRVASRDRDRHGPAIQRGLLYPRPRVASGEADGQLRRARHLPPLLRGREGKPVEPAHFLSVAWRSAGSAGCRDDDGNGVQRARGLTWLVAAEIRDVGDRRRRTPNPGWGGWADV